VRFVLCRFFKELHESARIAALNARDHRHELAGEAGRKRPARRRLRQRPERAPTNEALVGLSIDAQGIPRTLGVDALSTQSLPQAMLRPTHRNEIWTSSGMTTL
jgi:hypothetical protein